MCNENGFLMFSIREIQNKSFRNILSNGSITVVIVETSMLMSSWKYHTNFNVFIIMSGLIMNCWPPRKDTF